VLSVQLPVATWVFYGMVYFIALEYLVLAFSKNLKPHWRAYYIYTSSLFTVYAIYVTLRLSHVLDMTDYVAYVRWLAVGLAITTVFPGLFIHWEKTFYRKALEQRMPLP
jgi:hypothetical protein